MARMVVCKKIWKELEGLDTPPFPGPNGIEIFDSISKRAWNDLLEHQTRIINEKHLNMMDISARTYINEQREKFFSGDEIEIDTLYVLGYEIPKVATNLSDYSIYSISDESVDLDVAGSVLVPTILSIKYLVINPLAFLA